MYICIYIYIGFVTFIDILFIILSVALKFWIKDKNYYKQILLITSVRVSKKNQYSKTSRTRNKIFPANQLTAPSEVLQNYHLRIICTNPGILVVCWVAKCMVDDLQWL